MTSLDRHDESNRTREQWALRLAIVFVLLGIGLRFAQFLADVNLWHDETTIALDLMDRSAGELFAPSPMYNQTAPIGFLVLEKLVGEAYGYSERSLRLLPFLAGTLAVPLFYLVARWIVSPFAVVVAVALFAVSDPLIGFSAEVKQYTLDVLVLLVLTLLAVKMEARRRSWWLAALFATCAAVFVWFSSTAVFVLGGIALCTLWQGRPVPAEKRLLRVGVMHVPWVLSFVAIYLLYLRPLASQDLVAFWNGHAGTPGAPPGGAFVPFPPLSLAEIRWNANTFYGVFAYPCGLHLTGLAAVLFVCGCFALYSRRRGHVALLLMPIAFAIVASALKQYPFSGRVILFIAPALLLLVADGVDAIRRLTWDRARYVLVVLLALLFFYPLDAALRHLRHPRELTAIEPALVYIRDHLRPGDVVYINSGSERPYRYYQPRVGLDESVVTQSTNSHRDWKWDVVISDAERVAACDRVWTLFSGVWRQGGRDEEALFNLIVEQNGSPADTFSPTGVNVRLYDRTSPPAP